MKPTQICILYIFYQRSHIPYQFGTFESTIFRTSQKWNVWGTAGETNCTWEILGWPLGIPIPPPGTKKNIHQNSSSPKGKTPSSPGKRWMIRLMEKIRLTSWHGKYPSILLGSFHTCQMVVWDFFHQQYHSSSTHYFILFTTTSL